MKREFERWLARLGRLPIQLALSLSEIPMLPQSKAKRGAGF